MEEREEECWNMWVGEEGLVWEEQKVAMSCFGTNRTRIRM
jgi:hypothetical protein